MSQVTIIIILILFYIHGICITKVHFYYDIYTKLYYLLTSNSKRMVTVVRYSPDERRTETLLFTAYSGKDIASRPTTIIESTL